MAGNYIFVNYFRLFTNGFRTCFINNIFYSNFLVIMQEPQRFNLLGVLQKGLKAAGKKVYLHRLIYIASYARDESLGKQESQVFNILIESNIKLINDEYCEDVITGFGLFYVGYFINIVEGPEETIVKHLRTLVETFEQNLKKTPVVERIKVLLVSHHINKRYYSSWNGRKATPPLLLDKIEPSKSPEINFRHIQNCIMKLYRMSEYLRKQSPAFLRSAMDNISDLCQAHLPEVNLLVFLLESPALMDLKYYLNMYGAVPEYTVYHEIVWPAPPSFVPYNILGDDGIKKLMLTESSLRVKAAEGKDDDEATPTTTDTTAPTTANTTCTNTPTATTPTRASIISPPKTPRASTAMTPLRTPRTSTAVTPPKTPRTSTAVTPPKTPPTSTAVTPPKTPPTSTAITPPKTPPTSTATTPPRSTVTTPPTSTATTPPRTPRTSTATTPNKQI